MTTVEIMKRMKVKKIDYKTLVINKNATSDTAAAATILRDVNLVQYLQ